MRQGCVLVRPLFFSTARARASYIPSLKRVSRGSPPNPTPETRDRSRCGAETRNESSGCFGQPASTLHVPRMWLLGFSPQSYNSKVTPHFYLHFYRPLCHAPSEPPGRGHDACKSRAGARSPDATQALARVLARASREMLGRGPSRLEGLSAIAGMPSDAPAVSHRARAGLRKSSRSAHFAVESGRSPN